jgi:hypothetical protein
MHSHFSTWALTSRTIVDDLIPIVDHVQNFARKNGNLIKCSKMFGLLSFLGQK